MRLLGEIYSSLFVVFYRLGAGQWPEQIDFDTPKAVACVTMVEYLFFLAGFILIKNGTSSNFDPGFLGAAGVWFSMYLVNYLVLARLGVGSNFEKRFDDLPEYRRWLLYAAAILLTVLAGTAYLYTVNL